MRLIEYKQQLESMQKLGGMVKDLEYSEANTLSQERKNLHRNLILPMMANEYDEAKKELDELESVLIEMGYADPNEVDIDEVFDE